MKELIKVKNTIRDFLRKYEEIIFPILKFIWCFLVFHSIHNMFNYMDLFDRKLILILLAVMCAMLPDGFLVFITGVVMGVNCFSVNLEVGLSFVLLFLLMYCLYIRFFPKYSFVLYLVPLCYMINMPFLAPFLAAIFAGIGGALPAAFGVVLYRFSIYTRDIANMLKTTEDEESVEVLKYYLENILKNKEILMIMIVFMLTAIIISVVQRFSFPFSWYAAIGAGALVSIFSYMILGNILELPTDMSACVGGTLFGMLVAVVVQTAKGVLDFPRTQRVQFEDDEFYYYVKAVPKLDAPMKKKATETQEETERRPLTPEERERRRAAGRPLTPEERERRAAARAAAEGRRPLTPEERERRAAARAAAMEMEGRRPLTPEERERRAAARRRAEAQAGHRPDGPAEEEIKEEAKEAFADQEENAGTQKKEEKREEIAETEKREIKNPLTHEEREAERVAARMAEAVKMRPLDAERAKDEAVKAEPVKITVKEASEEKISEPERAKEEEDEDED